MHFIKYYKTFKEFQVQFLNENLHAKQGLHLPHHYGLLHGAHHIKMTLCVYVWKRLFSTVLPHMGTVTAFLTAKNNVKITSGCRNDAHKANPSTKYL